MSGKQEVLLNSPTAERVNASRQRIAHILVTRGNKLGEKHIRGRLFNFRVVNTPTSFK